MLHSGPEAVALLHEVVELHEVVVLHGVVVLLHSAVAWLVAGHKHPTVDLQVASHQEEL